MSWGYNDQFDSHRLYYELYMEIQLPKNLKLIICNLQISSIDIEFMSVFHWLSHHPVLTFPIFLLVDF